jgi:hypothetical protein
MVVIELEKRRVELILGYRPSSLNTLAALLLISPYKLDPVPLLSYLSYLFNLFQKSCMLSPLLASHFSDSFFLNPPWDNQAISNLNPLLNYSFLVPLSNNRGQWSETSLVKPINLTFGYLWSHSLEANTLSNTLLIKLSCLLIHVNLLPSLTISMRVVSLIKLLNMSIQMVYSDPLLFSCTYLIILNSP